jgi:hypothetical protein
VGQNCAGRKIEIAGREIHLENVGAEPQLVRRGDFGARVIGRTILRQRWTNAEQNEQKGEAEAQSHGFI